eukprot:393753_1
MLHFFALRDEIHDISMICIHVNKKNVQQTCTKTFLTKLEVKMTPTVTVWTIYRIFAAFELLILFIIIFYDHYQSHSAQTKKLNPRNPRWTKTYRVLSEIFILLTLFYTINLVLSQNNAYHISSDYGCYVRIVVNSILYNTSKAALYSLLVSRLCASYDGTPFKYSRSIIVSLFASIGIYTIYNAVNIITVMSGYFVGFDTSQISSCLFYARDVFSVLVVLLFDLIISIILLVLFLKPIHKLLKQNKDDPDFIQMIVKTSTLTSWVIFTSVFSIAIYAVFLQSIIVLILDNLMNVVGVLLMKQIHHNVYKKACRPFSKCCLCLCCCGYQTNFRKKKKKIQIAIDSEQPKEERSEIQTLKGGENN